MPVRCETRARSSLKSFQAVGVLFSRFFFRFERKSVQTCKLTPIGKAHGRGEEASASDTSVCACASVGSTGVDRLPNRR